jgi:FkbM family methyltransferase
MKTTKLQLLRQWSLLHLGARRRIGTIIRPLRLIDNARLRTERTILANLASLVADDPIMRVAEFEGNFAVNPGSDLFKRLATTGEYEPRLARLCVDVMDPSRDVVDVGANIGFFSVLCAKRIHSGSKVVAIEPTEGALRRLRRNLELNGVLDRVIVVAGAVGCVSGKTHLNVVPGREEYSSAGPLVHPSAERAAFVQQEALSFTLDELVARHNLNPGFIKVDVEGGEGGVFQGGQDTIKAFRPAVLSELSDPLLRAQGYRADDVVDQFRTLGYTVVDPYFPESTPGKRPYGDILCIPEGGSMSRRELRMRLRQTHRFLEPSKA